MAKIRTVNQLQDRLDADLSWRIKEIADLKTAVRRAGVIPERTIIRAGVALLYGHWEGWVKTALTDYVSFVNSQGMRYDQLKSCFVVFGLKRQINDLVASRSSSTSITAVDFLLGQMSEPAKLKIDTAINTQSNLGSEVLRNLLESVGFDPANFESKNNLIDESLLKRRNFIAHGEYIDIGRADWARLADEVILLMRAIKTQVENAAVLGSYARALPQPPPQTS